MERLETKISSADFRSIFTGGQGTLTNAEMGIQLSRSHRSLINMLMYTGRYIVPSGEENKQFILSAQSRKRKVREAYGNVSPELTRFGRIAFAFLAPVFRAEQEVVNATVLNGVINRKITRARAASIRMRETSRVNRAARKRPVDYTACYPSGMILPYENSVPGPIASEASR